MDTRVIIGLFADIMYNKGLLCFEEMDALLEITSAEEAYIFSDKLLRGDFNVYKRGEIYLESLASSAE